MLALLAALVLAALFFRGRAASERSRSAGAPVAPAPVEPAVALVAAEPASGSAGRKEADSLGPQAPAEPAPSADHEPEEENVLLVIEVVDGASNAPVAGAEVRHRTGQSSNWDFRASAPLEVIAASIPVVRTDEHGLARIEVPRSQAVQVLALVPGSVAWGVFDAPALRETGEHRERLVLVPDWDLPVEVVDDALNPVAGVPVALSVSFDGGSGGDSETTDHEGRVLFAHASYELARASDHALHLRIWLPLADNQETLVEHQPPPGEPVRLHLPAFGSVEVRVLEASGAPAKNDTEVELLALQPGETHEFPRFSRNGHGGMRDSTRDGRVLFEHVGLGLELSLEAGRLGEPESTRSFTPGPKVPGESVTLTLQLALAEAVLTFRAIDEGGQPVVGKLMASIEMRSGDLGSGRRTGVSTDGDGRFEVQVEPGLADGVGRELEVTAREGTLVGRLDLSRAFPPERIDMGNLVLARPPLIAEGRVIDQSGRPVAGVWIWWSVPRTELDVKGRRIGSSNDRTTSDGAFSFNGVLSAAHVEIQLHHERLRARPLEVPVGTSGIEIVALEPGGIAGGLLVDPGVDAVAIELKLRPESAPERNAGEPCEECEWVRASRKDARFQRTDLLPGTYTFTVTLADEALAEIPGLVITAGEIARDPRIQAIDLRGRLHGFTLDLRLPSSNFEPRGTLTYTAAGGGASRDLDFRSTPVSILTRLACIDATLRVIGCRSERLLDLGAHTEVHLRPGLPVRLALSPGLVLPGPPIFVGAMLATESGAPAAEDHLFDERGELLCHAPDPGRFKVRWFLELRDKGGSGRGDLTLPSEQVVTVADQEGEQRIELALTNQELAAALATR